MSLSVLLTILVMLVLNGLLAAYEIALASVRVDRLKTLAENRRRGAAAALRMKGRTERSLAVVQLGITLVGAIAAATGGASAEESLAPLLENHWKLAPYWADVLSVTLVVLPLSAVTIVIGELIPKVIAIKNSELVCVTLSPIMWVCTIILYPAVWVLELATMLVVSLFEKFFTSPTDETQGGLHELRAQVNLLRASQVIGMQEERIILQASRLSAIKVGEIMLEDEDIVMLVADAPLSENLIIAHMDLHTRFPVSVRKGDPQTIVGYVTFKDMVLLAKTHPGNPVLREIIRPLISLPIDMNLSDALKRMTAEHLHLALVRGQGGTVVGMISLEDIFEELVGDIQDEFDRLPKHISPSGNQIVVGGGVTLGQLRESLKRADLGRDFPSSTTINDWLNHGREDNLKGGDMITYDGVWAQVRKVRRKRITEALLDPLGNPFDQARSTS